MRTPSMILEAREGGRGEHWVVELLMFVLVFLVASAIEFIPLFITLAIWLTRNPEFLSPVFASLTDDTSSLIEASITLMSHSLPSWYFILSLFCTGIVVAAVFLFCHIFQKRSLATLGFRRPHALREYCVGAAAAVLAMTAVVVIGLLTGAYTISRSENVSVGMLLVYFAGYLIQGMSEEVLCRGYLMVSIARKNPVWLAVLLSSIVFSMLHLLNFGFTWLAFLNIVFFGVFMCVYILRRGNIWGVCAFHSLWNFTQGQIYGVEVSGTGTGTSLLTVHMTGPALWNGGDFGAEGGLIVTLVLAVGLCLLLFVMPRNEDEFSDTSS